MRHRNLSSKRPGVGEKVPLFLRQSPLMRDRASPCSRSGQSSFSGVTSNGDMRCRCALRPSPVEESAAAEQQQYDDDDEQSVRVHVPLPYLSRVIRHPTIPANTNRRLCSRAHPQSCLQE